MASTVLQCTSGMAYHCWNKTDITLELLSALQNHFLFVHCSIDTGKSIRQTDDSTHSHIQYQSVCNVVNLGHTITCTRLQWQHFVQWSLLLVGLLHETCFISPFRYLQFLSSFQIFGNFVDPCHSPVFRTEQKFGTIQK